MNFLRKPFRYAYYNITLWLICINVAIYALMFIMNKIFGIDLSSFLGLSFYGVIKQHYFWQPFTYMFVHGGFWHLLFNMLALFFFGFPTEKVIGSKEFILLYLLCGVLIGISSLGISYVTMMTAKDLGSLYVAIGGVLVGASGAIYSVLLTYAVCYPNSKIFIWGIIPVPAPLLILIYFVIEFIAQLRGNTSVAHYAHLLGFLFAWLYLVIRMGINPIRVWKNAYRK